jgi:hypothetical protein
MAAIRFSAAERPGLLADAVLYAGQRDWQASTLSALALAANKRDGKTFDEILSRDFAPVALERIGVTPSAQEQPEADPQTAGEV